MDSPSSSALPIPLSNMGTTLRRSNIIEIKRTFSTINLPWVPIFDEIFSNAINVHGGSYLEMQTVKSTMDILNTYHFKVRLDKDLAINGIVDKGVYRHDLGPGAKIVAHSLRQFIESVREFYELPPEPITELYLERAIILCCNVTANYIPYKIARKLAIIRVTCYCLQECYKAEKVAFYNYRWYIIPVNIATMDPSAKFLILKQSNRVIVFSIKEPFESLYVYDSKGL